MNIALENIKNQILLFVDDSQRSYVSGLTDIESTVSFIEKHMGEDVVAEMQNSLIQKFHKSEEIASLEVNSSAEMPDFDLLEEPKKLAVDYKSFPALANLNEALHDVEHYVASNLIRVVEIRNSNHKNGLSDKGLIESYGNIVAKSNEFSRLKKVYITSIECAIEHPEDIHSPIHNVNRILNHAKEVIDGINSSIINKS
jgi:fructose-specific component phosphotransferase system IIB-like protein